MKNPGETLVRKIIPFLLIFGGTGGITAAAMELAQTDKSFLATGLILMAYILAGTLIGVAYVYINEIKKGQNPVKRNEKGELMLVKQPIYALALAAAAVAFITNLNAGAGAAVIGGIFYGLGFLLGLANGIFEYRESTTKNLLYLGALPIGISFLYAYYMNKVDASIDMVWLFGSVYLFGYLLMVNRMQLNSIIFFRKSVNIENSRKIRRSNDILIGLFYLLYLFMFSFRKVINFSYNVIVNIINWLLIAMAAIMDWLLSDTGGGEKELTEKEDLPEFEETGNPWFEAIMKIVIYTVIAAAAIVAVVALVIAAIKLYKFLKEKLSEGFNRSVTEKKIESKEYEEESEIVKEEKSGLGLRKRRRKFQYNLKELKNIPLGNDKIRYVYGFVLERLYHKKVDIDASDTPEQILEKVKGQKNGEKLTKMGFEEFSRKYEMARYSGKEVEADSDLEKTGEAFEQAVSDIKVENKGKI